MLELFPKARHQYCYVRLARTISRLARLKVRKEILLDFKLVYRAGNAEEAAENLGKFLEKWSGKYSKLANMFSSQDRLFEFYRFPCTYYSDYNRKQAARIHLGFNAAESDLVNMFDNPNR